jgi:hypothetical protein
MDRNDEYLRLDRSARSFVIEPGDPLRLGLPLSGVFGRMDVGPVALCREFDGLWLLSNSCALLLTEQASAEVLVDEGVADRRVLCLSVGEVLRLDLAYRVEGRWANDLQRDADFTFTNAEDFDFGLFVANIVNDKEKLASFYAGR